MVEFYLLTFPRFPLRKKEHESYFGKNRTHDFRTSRCAAYLLDHSGDEHFWEDQCEWHRMTRITGPDCVVMYNLINIHTCIHTYLSGIDDEDDRAGLRGYVQFNIHTYIHTYIQKSEKNAETRGLVQ